MLGAARGGLRGGLEVTLLGLARYGDGELERGGERIATGLPRMEIARLGDGDDLIGLSVFLGLGDRLAECLGFSQGYLNERILAKKVVLRLSISTFVMP